MEGQVVINPKGSDEDSEELKILAAIRGIDDKTERLQQIVNLSGDAIKRIEEKILDAIFISAMDLPLYIVTMEILTEVFKEAINGMGDHKKGMEARLEMLRRVMDIVVIQGKEPE